MLDLFQVQKFQNLELLAKELVEGFITGLHRSPYHGFSVEFAEHKLYNYGESTKAIDWKVFARTDQLYTKQYEEETNLRASILLDTSASMYYPSQNKDKIRFSVYASAALATLMVRQRDSVGLVGYDEKINLQTQQKSSPVHLNNLYKTLHELLVRTPEKVHTEIAECLHTISDNIHRRSLVVLFTDMFQQTKNLDSIFTAMQHLKHNKHEVLLFHVTDQATEREFEFNDRPYRFIDPETDKSVTLQPHQIKEAYQKKMSGFYNSVKLGCGKLKIDLIEVDTKDPFNKVLSAYLIKRKKLN
ncbi:MAG: DUF58 domain-containing protein [Cyclobacteriaceae bacterium]